MMIVFYYILHETNGSNNKYDVTIVQLYNSR